ncbi:MAG TPA: SUMF1/EgtB/PvdO family nonheme iron enzyme [Blastocatellia bacterium]|nr:SUMF1/EgtB/PvdO family nonheme iron enzyme [Blastocatellia bacterium]
MQFSRLILTLVCVIALMPQLITHAQQDRALRVTAQGDRRVALIIGNSAYTQGALANPVNDARDIAAALRQANFEVLFGENQNRRQMRELIRQFGDRIRQGGVGLFYFAGHGVQVNSTNFLIPVGAEITEEHEIEDESIRVDFVLGQMEEARNKLNIVILDACRDNPFARSFRTAGERGLAVTRSAPTGTLIAYATAAGSVASDGVGRNGLFTQELLANLKTPGLTLETVFRRTRTSVRTKSNGRQVPYEYTSVEGEDFYFLPPGNAPLVSAPAPGASTASPTAPTIGTVRRNSLGMEFAYVPAGSFLMGSTEEDIKRIVGAVGKSESDRASRDFYKNEVPQHRVTISQPFYLGRYEVTQKQWEEVMGATVQQQHKKADITFNLSNVGPNQPMYFVSWEEAQQFIRRLNDRYDGFVYRLPTEAEWEYACRAVTTGDYAGRLNSLGWYGDNSGHEPLDSWAEWVKSGRDYQKYWMQFLKPNGNGTHEVGLKAPNAWGLYDMHGNVWEWCEDWYGNYASWHQTNPKGAPKGQYRVLRGGSWHNNGRACRSTSRIGAAPDARSEDGGFRVAAVARTQ